MTEYRVRHPEQEKLRELALRLRAGGDVEEIAVELERLADRPPRPSSFAPQSIYEVVNPAARWLRILDPNSFARWAMAGWRRTGKRTTERDKKLCKRAQYLWDNFTYDREGLLQQLANEFGIRNTKTVANILSRGGVTTEYKQRFRR